MDYTNNTVTYTYKDDDISENFYFFNVLKDGRVHVLAPDTPDAVKIPPSDDVTTGVKIKDISINDDVSARVFLPPSRDGGGEKVPVFLYVHGGAFCMGSAFSVEYTRFLSTISKECGVISVSVEYGLFPTRLIPACYEDCWFALQWLASHGDLNFNEGQDPWIKDHADLTRIFVGGDSAGGNICHTLATRAGKLALPGRAKVEGMILIHPYFHENDRIWLYMCPTNDGPQDPRMKPAAEDLANLGCDRVLVFIGEKDFLRDAGKMYVKELSKSGWKGSVELMENLDKEHCFYLGNYLDEEAIAINERIKLFIRRGKANM
ncbi:2-hydroxyisoflavanone dehydratase-like [Silene latifolia]|uniref:2-hydroxyisoflavanone dehydratase-like n=1 Tax=Silene latifolia TaxID=37657 RepID=UPI003D788424